MPTQKSWSLFWFSLSFLSLFFWGFFSIGISRERKLQKKKKEWGGTQERGRSKRRGKPSISDGELKKTHRKSHRVSPVKGAKETLKEKTSTTGTRQERSRTTVRSSRKLYRTRINGIHIYLSLSLYLSLSPSQPSSRFPLLRTVHQS